MLNILLVESTRLHEALLDVIDSAAPYPGDRFSIAMVACGIAFEHASGVRILAKADLATSAAALLRVQFEALVRAMWLLYAATDAEVQTLLEPLSADTQKAAHKLPMAAQMLKALESTAPPTAIHPLLQFKELSAGPMNSFVHSGLHALQRQREGFPTLLVDQVVRTSNALNTICAMLGAVLTGDSRRVATVNTIQQSFRAALPPLVEN